MSSKLNYGEEKNQELLKYKYLLGEMGLQILVAIFKGATQKESIMMFSGVPMECINSRIPVLLDLSLISIIQDNNEYIITKTGIEFLTLLDIRR